MIHFVQFLALLIAVIAMVHQASAYARCSFIGEPCMGSYQAGICVDSEIFGGICVKP